MGRIRENRSGLAGVGMDSSAFRGCEEVGMFCPRCGAEYREGVTECADCGVRLVDSLPEPPPEPQVELITVLASSDPAVILVAKSVLEQAGILCVAKNERLQDLFAMGRLGHMNLLIGPVEIQVERKDAERARSLLQRLKEVQEVNG
jgi:hypothetical protein